MKQKELRLALVCYGGVSLAVYMYGVTREVQKLVRASKTYFAEMDPTVRQTARYADLNSDKTRESDSEQGYFELLQEIAAHGMELKVLVDIISGASAGGINGIFLARALAHDLPLDPLRDMWLTQADVEQLIDPSNIRGPLIRMAKWPALWAMRARNFADIRDLEARVQDPEIGKKLALFVTSRWLHPPFSGRWLSDMLLRGARAMGRSDSDGETLVPGTRSLDLFVTVTDFHGHRQTLSLHDPKTVEEVEHRLSLSFQHKRAALYPREDFADNNLAAIIFAARATSSYPGAFPPAQIVEMDKVLANQRLTWPGRQAFLDNSFATHITAGLDPAHVCLIDGSVLNNKPFGPVIDVLRQRIAHREVDRRIVYIDPNPPTHGDEQLSAPPGYLKTLSGAVSAIPRNQPIRDDLEAVQAVVTETTQIRQVVAEVYPRVEQTIERLLGGALRRINLSPRALGEWRKRADLQAERRAGFAYDGYLSLRLLMLVENLIHSIARHSRQDISEIETDVRAWAEDQGYFPFDANNKARPWDDFLHLFDVDFRVRRIRFVIRRINQLYGDRTAPSEALDSLKGLLYTQHSALRGHLFGPLGFHLRREDSVTDRLDDLAKAFQLDQVDDKIDAAISAHLQALDEKALGREILIAYLGFDFFDTVTFPLSHRHNLEELDQVLVDRISPEDARSLSDEGKAALRGLELGSFGAFFSSTFRENDYLWGRLHGAERLVDILTSSAAASGIHIDSLCAKQRLFRAILEREAPRLEKVQGLASRLSERTEALYDPAAEPAPPLDVPTAAE